MVWTDPPLIPAGAVLAGIPRTGHTGEGGRKRLATLPTAPMQVNQAPT
jgi:hypothetical protein